MKLSTRATSTVVGGNTEAPRTFNINANGVAFSVLSSGLYNDKIRAIIRELSCNAWDAHVMAGKGDLSFEIHLPTDFEPVFRITDYGTGLSHEDVMNLYCTYFATNKNDSNDVVGAMGLGSKSPFCYTQSQDDSQGFTVVSRFQGVKRIYSAYVQEGAPTIVCLGDEPTTDPDGLEVEFPVNSDDVWEFENKAKKALEFFEPMPKVNVEGFEAEKQTYAIRTPKWALRTRDAFSGLRAIQGMVQYNVGSIDISRMTVEQQRVAELPLDLFFSIGDLSVAASREMLSNDQRTIGNILKMLTDVHNDMIEEVRKTLNGCKFAWEARLKLMLMITSDLAPLIQNAYDEGKFFGTYKNFTLTEQKPMLNELDFKTIQVTKYERSGKKKAIKNTLFQPRTDSDRQLVFAQVKADVKIQKNFMREIEVNENVIFILNDLGIRGTERYIQAYVQGRNDTSTYFCKIAYVFSTMASKAQMKKMKKEFKKAMDIIGNPTFVTVSYLKQNFQYLVDAMKPTPRPRVTGILEVTGDGRSCRQGENAGWSRSTWSKVPEANIPAGLKFYIPVEDRRLGGSARDWRFHDAKEFVTFVNNAKLSKLFPNLDAKSHIFGLTEKAITRKDGDPNWVNVLDHIADNAQTAISDATVLKLSIFLEPFTCDHEDILKAILRDEAEYAGSSLVEFARVYLAVKGKKKEAEAEAISELITKLTAVGKYKRGEVMNFKSLWRKIVTEHYPLLGFNFNRYYGTSVGVSYEKSVLQYVKLMDTQREAI